MDSDTAQLLAFLGMLGCGVAAFIIKARGKSTIAELFSIHKRAEHETLSEDEIRTFVTTVGKIVKALPLNTGKQPIFFTACVDLCADTGRLDVAGEDAGEPLAAASRAVFEFGGLLEAMEEKRGGMQEAAICMFVGHAMAFLQKMHVLTGIAPTKKIAWPTVRSAGDRKRYAKEYLRAAAVMGIDATQAQERLNARLAALPDDARTGGGA